MYLYKYINWQDNRAGSGYSKLKVEHLHWRAMP